MHSPSDLSPNAPPAGFDDPFKNLAENSNVSKQGTASTEGSIDSSGFEKVEHDVLEEYGHNFAQQMQQSIFGQLPDDPDGHDDDFVIIPSKSLVNKMEEELPGVEKLHRDPPEIDKPYPSDIAEEIAPRHLSNQKEQTPDSQYSVSTPSPAPRSKDLTAETPNEHHDESEKHSEALHLEEHCHNPEEDQRKTEHDNHSPQSHELVKDTVEPHSLVHHDKVPIKQNDDILEPESTPSIKKDLVSDPVAPKEEDNDQHYDMDDKHDLSHESQHYDPSKGADLIDIPSNDSSTHEPGYGNRHYDQICSDLPESPLIPESHEFLHEDHHLSEPHHEEHLPEPVYHDEHMPQHHSFTDDLLDIGQKAKELVDAAVQEAGDKIHHAEQTTNEATHHFDDDEIQKHVDSVHDTVNDIVESMNKNDDFQHSSAQMKDSDEEPEPDFRRTPEPEETTYERDGPLTIPEIPDQQEEEDLLHDVISPAPAVHDGHRHGFETKPRPPTPPKDISDEDVKPSLVNLGSGHSTHSHSNPHHSILKHTAEPWFDFKHVDPCVLDLVYWRDPKKSAIALCLSLLVVFIFAKYPLLSIISYTGLAVLAGTLGFRIFKTIEGRIKKTGEENPFQEYLNKDLNVPQDKVHAQVDVLSEHAVHLINKAKKLIFVENIFESVKFVLLLWSLTYVSAWFSGFVLVILTIIGIFTLPKVYETYQEPIDQQIAVISGHLNNVIQLCEEKLPFLKRAAADAEKKDQ